MDIVERAFRLYLQGWSLRKLQGHFAVDHSTFGKLFQQRYGKNYRHIKNFIPVVEEYLQSSSVRETDKQKIRDWLVGEQLLNILITQPTNVKAIKLYTERQIESFTKDECGHRSRDWRSLFELINFK